MDSLLAVAMAIEGPVRQLGPSWCSSFFSTVSTKAVARVLSARRIFLGSQTSLWQDRPIARRETTPRVFDCSVKHEQCIRIVLLICEVIRAPVSHLDA